MSEEALLIEHFTAVTDADGGLARIRALILDRAIRGSLGRTASSEEPVAALLERARSARADSLAERGWRDSARNPISRDEEPFAIPNEWRWVRLGELAYPQAGFAFRSNGFNEAGHGMPLLRIRDLGNATTECHYEGDYRPEFVVSPGDYLVGMDGNFNIRRWSGPPALLNQRVARLVFFTKEVQREFICWALQARINDLHGTRAYTTVQHLSGKQISNCAVPVPPRAEQERIVSTVGTLMGLCDELERALERRTECQEAVAVALTRS